MTPKRSTVVIENLDPLIDCGRFAVKRVIGEDLVVQADIFKDGHDVVAAALKWRKKGARRWEETDMKPLGNDRWQGVCSFHEIGPHEVTVEAWPDFFESWREEYRKKFEGGQRQLESEILEGTAWIRAAAKRARSRREKTALEKAAKELENSAPEEVLPLVDNPEILTLMHLNPDRTETTLAPVTLPVWVDRQRARFAAWYEFFPRSAEGNGAKGSTFRDCLERVDDARRMGFDVIYFPPIHPIGETNRKGRNNSVTCEPGEPGVPYAIGGKTGGHMAVEPALGTLKDFEWLVGEIHKRGMEVALDFAINCSPDHPYVRDHPDWFYKRPDGTIKYAENPPKKYQDVYPLNFHCTDWKSLWQEMRAVLLFWAEHGVRIFRVDNPHTKPVVFWEWVINEVQTAFPDVIFLSEAFTRPKMMKALAKSGFTQSYTYFTWRNTKEELTEYFTELTQTEMKDYFRANLWPNTPDILPFFLQTGGRPAFMIRAVLAATLSPIYGIYSGFELCENQALPGREEYADSEKYQLKERDWNSPGNIKELITTLNRIRCSNRALQQYANLTFLPAQDEKVLFYEKSTESLDNVLLIAVNLDPTQTRSSLVRVPLEKIGLSESETYQMEDLLQGKTYFWRGTTNYVELNPFDCPAHIFRLRRYQGREQAFDYFA